MAGKALVTECVSGWRYNPAGLPGGCLGAVAHGVRNLPFIVSIRDIHSSSMGKRISFGVARNPSFAHIWQFVSLNLLRSRHAKLFPIIPLPPWLVSTLSM